MNDSPRYLDPRVLERVSGLELRARFVVEGFLSGLHRSPLKGVSVEFAQHREYVPGDDLRHLDWKVLGKTDRAYIKEYEEETNLRLYLLVDGSESMFYPPAAPGEPPPRSQKYEYAAVLGTALAALAQRQHDAAGLMLFDDDVRAFLPAGTNPMVLRGIAGSLEQQAARGGTRLGDMLEEAARRIPHRSLLALLSDMLDEPERIVAGLKRLRRMGHDIIVFHILHPDERDFPFESLTRFEGLESMPALLANPRSLRESYLRALRYFVQDLERQCRAEQIDRIEVHTDRPPEHWLLQSLGMRARARERGR